jgi:hypothetical protein
MLSELELHQFIMRYNDMRGNTIDYDIFSQSIFFKLILVLFPLTLEVTLLGYNSVPATHV